MHRTPVDRPVPSSAAAARCPGVRARRTGAALALVLGVVAFGGATNASAASDWPPADLSDYVDSGQYLTDVQAAVVPARAWLVSRTDQIVADRRACDAVGIPYPTPVPPTATGAAAVGGSAASASGVPAPAASPAAGASAGSAATGVATARTRGVARGAAAGSRAAAPAWTGAVTIVPDGRAAAVRRLQGGRARWATSKPAAASWSRVLLPVARVAGTRASTSLVQRGDVRLTAGRRSVVLRDVRVSLRGRAVRLTAAIGGRRRTVLVGTAPQRGRTVDPAGGAVRVPATRVRLAAPGAAAIGRALGVRTLRPGAFGRLTIRVARATPKGPPVTPPGPPVPPRGPDVPPPGPIAPPAPTPPTAETCAAIPARPALVLDIDETALSNYIGTSGDPEGGDAGYALVSVTGQGTALQPVFDVYAEARRRGVAVFFITARPGIIEPQTVANLRRVGYDAWDGLTFKNDLSSAKDVHKTGERKKVEDAGYRIVLNVGDQQTDIDGGYAERAFKLPNPFY